MVDAGMGNLASVERALRSSAGVAGESVELSRSGDPDVLRAADGLVFPGQGAFRDCARALDAGLREAIGESIAAGKPYLGLCLGLQVLFASSEEAPDPSARGLGILPGVVARMKGSPGVKIPHMGWNTVEPLKPSRVLFGAPEHFYFVHSFAVVPADDACVLGTTTHGATFVSAVERDNVVAFQFHPEKSQAAGLALLARFWEAAW